MPRYQAESRSDTQEEMLNVNDLPKMKCDRCGACCGPSYASQKEYSKIKQYMKENSIRPVKNKGLMCPLFQNDACAVYPVRPMLCRLFGHTERLLCRRGNNVNVPDRKIRKLFLKNVDQNRPLFDLRLERDLYGPEEKAKGEEQNTE